jgi:hypothetical protein
VQYVIYFSSVFFFVETIVCEVYFVEMRSHAWQRSRFAY